MTWKTVPCMFVDMGNRLKFLASRKLCTTPAIVIIKKTKVVSDYIMKQNQEITIKCNK